MHHCSARKQICFCDRQKVCQLPSFLFACFLSEAGLPFPNLFSGLFPRCASEINRVDLCKNSIWRVSLLKMRRNYISCLHSLLCLFPGWLPEPHFFFSFFFVTRRSKWINSSDSCPPPRNHQQGRGTKKQLKEKKRGKKMGSIYFECWSARGVLVSVCACVRACPEFSHRAKAHLLPLDSNNWSF